MKSKLARAAPARDLYTSSLFIGRRRFVERTCAKWFILSAKHGLVDPEAELEPYDQTLSREPVKRRRAWSEAVVADLQRRLGNVRGELFEIHAGTAYRDFGLVRLLELSGATVEVPAAGLTQGQQLAFYRGGGTGGTGRRNSSPKTTSVSSSYAGLAQFLETATNPVELTFRDVERIINRQLPASALRRAAWWANSPSHAMASVWLASGWRAVGVDLNRQTIRLRR